jgi:cell division protein FtsB
MSDLIELLDSLAADLADREAEVESLKAKVAELEAALAKLHEQEGTEEWNEQ